MVHTFITASRGACLAAVGFLLTTLGLHAGDGATSTLRTGSSLEEEAVRPMVATACIPDKDTADDEIFFLSCGGLF